MEEITVNGNTMESGCYVQGSWGQYGASRVLRIADDLLGTSYWQQAHDEIAEGIARGLEEFKWTDSPLGMMTNELIGCQLVSEIADEAVDKMNENTDPAYSWGWYDGEFYLWSQEKWEQE